MLDRIARGLRNEAIAVRIGISVKTVQNNVSSILLKLRARDRAHLVAMARDAGLGMEVAANFPIFPGNLRARMLSVGRSS